MSKAVLHGGVRKQLPLPSLLSSFTKSHPIPRLKKKVFIESISTELNKALSVHKRHITLTDGTTITPIPEYEPLPLCTTNYGLCTHPTFQETRMEIPVKPYKL